MDMQNKTISKKESQFLNYHKSTSKTESETRAVRLLNFLSQAFSDFEYKLSGSVKKFNHGVQVWSEGIVDLTNEELRVGCRWVNNAGLEYAPSLSRFRFKCFGLVDPDLAYDCWINGTADMVVLNAVNKISSWDRKRMSETELRKKIRIVYISLCEKVVAKEINLQPVPKILEQKEEAFKPKVRTKNGSEWMRKIKELAYRNSCDSKA